jgi:Fur family zinc uptake transcriptional regulator
LICRQCKNVGELNSNRVSERIEKDAVEAGFQVDQQLVEIIGICYECAESG